MASAVQQNMFRMDVAMAEVALMTVIQCGSDPTGDPNNFAMVRQFQPTDHFGDAGTLDVLQRAEEAVALRLTNFDQSDYIWVVECSKNPCLLSQSIRDHLAKFAGTMDDIQPHELAGRTLTGLVDQVSVTPEQLDELIARDRRMFVHPAPPQDCQLANDPAHLRRPHRRATNSRKSTRGRRQVQRFVRRSQPASTRSPMFLDAASATYSFTSVNRAS